MAERRRYTKQQKLKAVAEAEVNGAESAAERTGIPRTTILYWLDRPEFVAYRQKTRDDLAEGFRALAHMAQQRLAEVVPNMEPRDVTILLGVATDKTLLLSGDATARTEHKDLTHGLDPAQQRRIREWLASLASAEGDRGGAGDGVALPSPEGAAASD